MRLAYASLALFTLLATSAGPSMADPSGLMLNEFVAGPARDWDGSGAFSSRDDEWVEVVNRDSGPIDLQGYFITDGDSIPRFEFSGTLDGFARRVVFGKESYDWERATGHPAFGLSLGNSGDVVMLWKIAAGETLLVDSYAYRSHEAAADRAVGRHDDRGEWHLFDAFNPYTGATPPPGNGCSPSPGGANICGITDSRPVTWGRIKALYR